MRTVPREARKGPRARRADQAQSAAREIQGVVNRHTRCGEPPPRGARSRRARPRGRGSERVQVRPAGPGCGLLCRPHDLRASRTSRYARACLRACVLTGAPPCEPARAPTARAYRSLGCASRHGDAVQFQKEAGECPPCAASARAPASGPALASCCQRGSDWRDGPHAPSARPPWLRLQNTYGDKSPGGGVPVRIRAQPSRACARLGASCALPLRCAAGPAAAPRVAPHSPCARPPAPAVRSPSARGMRPADPSRFALRLRPAAQPGAKSPSGTPRLEGGAGGAKPKSALGKASPEQGPAVIESLPLFKGARGCAARVGRGAGRPRAARAAWRPCPAVRAAPASCRAPASPLHTAEGESAAQPGLLATRISPSARAACRTTGLRPDTRFLCPATLPPCPLPCSAPALRRACG